jgi:hypothetical protein
MNPFLFGNPAALGQQTTAVKLLTMGAAGNGMRGSAPRRRKRKTAAKSRPAARRVARARRAKPARLVKGSAAAKRYMASIRRKRRK